MGGIVSGIAGALGMKPNDRGYLQQSGNATQQGQGYYNNLGDMGRYLMGYRFPSQMPGAGSQGNGQMQTYLPYGRPLSQDANATLGQSQYGGAGIIDKIAGLTGGTEASSYALAPVQQARLNQQIAGMQRQRQVGTANATQSLAARGITSGPAYEAAMQRLNDYYDQTQNEATTNYMEQMRSQQLGEYQNLANYMSGLLGQAGAGNMQAAGSYGNTANQYMEQDAAGINNLLGLATMFTGVPGMGKSVRSSAGRAGMPASVRMPPGWGQQMPSSTWDPTSGSWYAGS